MMPHKDPEVAREYHFARKLLTRYGVTVEQVAAAWRAQDGRCKICDRALQEGGRKSDSPHIDHDHETGVFRGLLCHGCNSGLGMFRDDPGLLATAIAYLSEWQPAIYGPPKEEP